MPTSIVAQMLRGGLYTAIVGRSVRFYQTTPSTMDDAAEWARAGAEDGAVVVAETQTASRGRRGRRWVSEAGNLYLSVLLRPDADRLPLLNALAGVAVARAVRRVAGVTPSIKWPNDIMVEGRKVAGILAESALSGGQVEYAVVGIGVNIGLEVSGDAEIADTAGSLNALAGVEVDRVELLRRILQYMDALYLDLGRGRSPVAEWRRWLDTLGQRVAVTHYDAAHTGLAEDVDDWGNLILRTDDGRRLTLSAGDITLRNDMATANQTGDSAAVPDTTVSDATVSDTARATAAKDT